MRIIDSLPKNADKSINYEDIVFAFNARDFLFGDKNELSYMWKRDSGNRNDRTKQKGYKNTRM